MTTLTEADQQCKAMLRKMILVWNFSEEVTEKIKKAREGSHSLANWEEQQQKVAGQSCNVPINVIPDY